MDYEHSFSKQQYFLVDHWGWDIIRPLQHARPSCLDSIYSTAAAIAT